MRSESEIEMARDREREVKMKKNSREFCMYLGFGLVRVPNILEIPCRGLIYHIQKNSWSLDDQDPPRQWKSFWAGCFNHDARLIPQPAGGSLCWEQSVRCVSTVGDTKKVFQWCSQSKNLSLTYNLTIILNNAGFCNVYEGEQFLIQTTEDESIWIE